jgi:hypothetical protein
VSVIDCPSCEEGGYDSEGERDCCGVHTLTCESHEVPVEWVEATGDVVSSGKGEVCVCQRTWAQP